MNPASMDLKRLEIFIHFDAIRLHNRYDIFSTQIDFQWQTENTTKLSLSRLINQDKKSKFSFNTFPNGSQIFKLVKIFEAHGSCEDRWAIDSSQSEDSITRTPKNIVKGQSDRVNWDLCFPICLNTKKSSAPLSKEWFPYIWLNISEFGLFPHNNLKRERK